MHDAPRVLELRPEHNRFHIVLEPSEALERRVAALEAKLAAMETGAQYPDEMTTEQAARFLGYAPGTLIVLLKRRENIRECAEKRGAKWWWNKAKLERVRAGR